MLNKTKRNSAIAKRLTAAISAVVFGVGVNMAVAEPEEDWEFMVEGYGWLPNIDIKEEGGQNLEITLDDILDDLDITAMVAGEARKGKWSFSADVMYLDLSQDIDEFITPRIELKKLDLEAWITTPAIGYNVLESDRHQVDLYVGARYLWIDVPLVLEETIDGIPVRSNDTQISGSNWDAIAGVRGNYRLSDKWYVPYSFNAGAGESNFTGQANAAFAYEFASLDAVIGWRYMTWDLGETLDELTINGPFLGAILRF